ncbi:bifunctional 5-dehydro-2-deoxygluconokinase/5-dehydro-2-deoxyphosphogluconate aldolase [Rugamonas sp. DEMB1]|uniref:bifunctional 5-dehydro-2-deoxygluconokinase/5-dehydro-2- deoxyphosphogluconate aldolase n=1 Tax=Rugamonas sp. DEMB1 TaxID=3039386 RepID=UPI00244C0DB1|nr:5-dehydro-2-deoxygluconokinase [Rugamonas sp. DEMB1]WGG49916.1 5-dehydro-2-deoxygluconokinase [Rugamonas sp. DEMB1]
MNNTTQFAANRALDLICLGRLAVDLYAQQIGARLEDVTSFAKYLGGSSANIAFGSARLGLRSAMLSRVGDDHMGRFLTETLQAEGCDTSHVSVDPERLTAMVTLGLKDRDTFPLIFYRENCADMAIRSEDVDEAYIASSRALLITGTHFSTAAMHQVSSQALAHARRNKVRTVLDIDYRPVLWGLSPRADGATRFVSNDGVTRHLQGILPLFDLVVGTEEEFMIAGGGADIIASLAAVRAATPATLVVKRGPLGCAVIEGAIPASLDAAFNYQGVQVEVMNVLGAGDAFLAGFLSQWLRGADYTACCRSANACGALVVARHACAPAMPTPAELDYFLANAARLQRPGEDAQLNRLHRVTARRAQWDELCVFAFDHRNQFFDMAQQLGADEQRVPRLKQLLVQAVAQTEAALQLAGGTGVLIDDRYGAEALNAATGRGWWIGRPVELPGSNPLVFDWGRSIGSHLVSWPKEHVIKCLVQLHPDDQVENRLEQEAQVKALYDAAQISGHELLLEVIPSKAMAAKPDTVLRAVKRLYNIGVYPEWWKLEHMDENQWRAIDALVQERDPYCRGVVLLGLHASIDELAASFQASRHSGTCRGFMVGRTIFHAPSTRWLAGQIDDAALIAEVRANFESLIRIWRQTRQVGRQAGSQQGMERAA